MKLKYCAIGILILLIMAVTSYTKAGLNQVSMTNAVSNLKEIATTYQMYVSEYKMTPSKIENLKLSENTKIDRANNNTFKFTLRKYKQNKDLLIVAEQTAPVCIEWWPIGKHKRHAAFSDGSVRDLMLKNK